MSEERRSILEVNAVNKTFRGDQGSNHVLDEINLTVKEGDFTTIIGPSGCGKSTLLKIVAGLDTDYEGDVLLKGKRVERPSQEKGFIFQEHRLFPWLSVEQNIAADLSLKDSEVRSRVDALIELVKLKGFEKAFPRELSGGMSQRVAIARALIRNPEVMLLDEPFGALDAFTRGHMQEALLDIWQTNKTAMVLVTHDIDEAVFLSTRVVVMDRRPGRIKAIVPIDLPYPRKRTSRSFIELRTLVLDELDHREEQEAYSI
ncbi:ABC transporter ATP-binding protein [Paenibacillus urinalis]|uniref:ABC transporter ATP-binding protein n=1 Tax=Paenibacillus urinalis TaxID=521520 RepID=A0AAX3MWB1_9BACL|nr:ABC transporter ATP-binding protein [Paenibacillus urinalis]WDH80624.1 ABC transporter ATP-binding protein [Paenibacillus urinalis]WDH96676.1 ABC transporter ATP-binding protein [Paenibacillus urinalis]WDI00320.1 ABC transporter ATP-binding protein [Paenibacillus urinalis]